MRNKFIGMLGCFSISFFKILFLGQPGWLHWLSLGLLVLFQVVISWVTISCVLISSPMSGSHWAGSLYFAPLNCMSSLSFRSIIQSINHHPGSKVEEKDPTKIILTITQVAYRVLVQEELRGKVKEKTQGLL